MMGYLLQRKKYYVNERFLPKISLFPQTSNKFCESWSVRSKFKKLSEANPHTTMASDPWAIVKLYKSRVYVSEAIAAPVAKK